MSNNKNYTNNKRRKSYVRDAKKQAARGNYQDAAELKERAKGGATDKEDAWVSKKFPNKVIGNNPEWYWKDPKVLESVASFSFATPLGTDLNDVRAMSPNPTSHISGGANTVPGLMSLELGLTPGVANDAQDPVNLAAQNIYTFVRYKNSGHANYDPTDLMLYLIAMDSAYVCWNWLKRIYGYTSTYSQMNRYQPKAYAEAENVDLDDVYSHLADFRAYINMAAARLSAFCVPAVMTYFVRHSWLFSNIWKDSDTTKAQQYMYVPSYFYMYDETGSSAGGRLIPLSILYNRTSSTKKYTTSQLTGFMDTIINALQYSEDIGIISGDILKAYGDSRLFTVSSIEADYRVEAVYDKGVLSQIENSIPAVTFNGISQFNITQDPNTNYLKFAPQATFQPGTFNERIGYHLNFHWNDPTANDVIEATRLQWSAGWTDSTKKTLVLTSCGSEIVLKAVVYYYAQSTTLGTQYIEGAQLSLQQYVWRDAINASPDVINPETTDLVKQIYLGMAFDWSPQWRVYYNVGTTNPTAYILPPIKDWDIYTLIDNANIKALNLMALLSEFDVPT